MDPILHVSIPVNDVDSSREFYIDVLGCIPGQRGDSGMDVWFFGLQLTLQVQPAQVLPVEDQGCRHFGVTLDGPTLDALLLRLQAFAIEWVRPPSAGGFRGKTSAKLADPSGNVIEFKAYDDPKIALAQP